MPAGLHAWARQFFGREFTEHFGTDPRRLLVQLRIQEQGRSSTPLGRTPESIRTSAARELDLGAWRVLVVLEELSGDHGRLVCEAWQPDVDESVRFVQPVRRGFGGILVADGQLAPGPPPPLP